MDPDSNGSTPRRRRGSEPGMDRCVGPTAGVYPSAGMPPQVVIPRARHANQVNYAIHRGQVYMWWCGFSPRLLFFFRHCHRLLCSACDHYSFVVVHIIGYRWEFRLILEQLSMQVPLFRTIAQSLCKLDVQYDAIKPLFPGSPFCDTFCLTHSHPGLWVGCGVPVLMTLNFTDRLNDSLMLSIFSPSKRLAPSLEVERWMVTKSKENTPLRTWSEVNIVVRCLLVKSPIGWRSVKSNPMRFQSVLKDRSTLAIKMTWWTSMLLTRRQVWYVYVLCFHAMASDWTKW